MKPELLSPAGSFDAAVAAFQFGADAVYLGLPKFSARADADNMTPEKLQVLLAYARSFTPAKKVYITFNTLVKKRELPLAIELLETLAQLRPDGLIVQDLGIARIIRKHYPMLTLHASTQLAAHSLEGVLALKELGFTRVVLARELTMEEIHEIVQKCGIEIEIFVHGALCYSMSGLCLFSSHASGRSGNRGRCAYCCREAFHTGDSNKTSFPFSMKDLALGPILDQVTATGAHSLKIEGRMKSPYYVACVTDYYRKNLDGILSPEEDRLLVQDLQTVFSRPWTTLYAEGRKAAPESIIDPIGMGHRGAKIGTVHAILRDRDGSCRVRFTTNRTLEKHDGLQIELPTGGKPFGCPINIMRICGRRDREISVPAETDVEIQLPNESLPPIPKGSLVFCSASQAVRRRYEASAVRESELSVGDPVDIHVTLKPDAIQMTASHPNLPQLHTELSVSAALSTSRQPEKTPAAVRKAFSRTGGSGWYLSAITCDDPQGCYAPPSLLNEARRQLLDRLSETRTKQQEAHRQAVLNDCESEGTQSPESEQQITLKCTLDQSPLLLPKEITRLVLDIGDLSKEQALASMVNWKRAVGDAVKILPAVPVLVRNHLSELTDQTIRALIEQGYSEWECADLSGCHRLLRLGAKVVSSDWFFYVSNPQTAKGLAEFGISRFVLSSELDEQAIRPLLSLTEPKPELLLFQHTPLFLSETRPCISGNEEEPIINRHGDELLICSHAGHWHTVSKVPFSLAGTSIVEGNKNLRIDFSWSPKSGDFNAILRALVKGEEPPFPTHSANFKRTLL